jgi:hypothetical protein
MVESHYLAACDTDSCLYAAKACGSRTTEDSKIIPEGEAMGCFVDEIKKDFGADAVLNKILAMGPKQYILEVTDQHGKVHRRTKLRGFSMNAEVEQKLTLEVMESLVRHEHSVTGSSSSVLMTLPLQKEIPIHYKHNIFRNLQTKELYTGELIKKYRIVCDKRIKLLNSFVTYPYGYRCLRDRKCYCFSPQ